MNKNLAEISDGKIYEVNDMVRAACNDCEGCHYCCEDMGQSIILDPYDIYQLEKNRGITFEQLLAENIELGMVDGMILPNMKMSNDRNCCTFLNEQGRCTIHNYRPGICKLFPLGRVYEEDQIRYFLQSDGCRKDNRSKVKVSKWLDTPDLKRYEAFLVEWHEFRKLIERIVVDTPDENTVKTITMFLLNTFFMNPYDVEQEFYPQFYERLNKIKGALGL